MRYKLEVRTVTLAEELEQFGKYFDISEKDGTVVVVGFTHWIKQAWFPEKQANSIVGLFTIIYEGVPCEKHCVGDSCLLFFPYRDTWMCCVNQEGLFAVIDWLQDGDSKSTKTVTKLLLDWSGGENK